MIYIVHGDDVSKSRALILNQQKKLYASNKTEINLSDISPEDLLTTIKRVDIFGAHDFIVINASGISPSLAETSLEILAQTSTETSLIIYSEKTLTQNNILIKNATKIGAKIIHNELKVEGSVFNLVDAVVSKNRKQTYQIMERELNKGADPFELFGVLLYGLRSLANTLLNTSSFKKMKPYMQSKYLGLSKKYTLDKVKNLFFQFYALDKKAKTGDIDPDMMLTLAIENMLNS